MQLKQLICIKMPVMTAYEGNTVMDPVLLDGIEVFIGHPRHKSRNNLAYNFARENNLKMISGSDFHREQDLATGGGVLIPRKVNTSGVLFELLEGDKIYRLIRSS